MRHLQSPYRGCSRYLNRGFQETEAIHSSGQRYVEEKNWPHVVLVLVCFVNGLFSCTYVMFVQVFVPG